MAKNKVLKKDEIIFDDLDFSDVMTGPDDEMLAGIAAGLMDASNFQLQVAVDLTRLIVEKSSEQITAEKVFSTFKQATQVISENLPLRELLNKVN